MATETQGTEVDGKVFITYEQAVEMLPLQDRVHTFRNPAPSVLIGADWDLQDILKAMATASSIQLTGPSATAMKHGMAISDDNGLLFIETREGGTK